MRVALVTGGIRGIGAAIAVQLKNDGYTVLANYVENEESAEKFSFDNNIPVIRFNVSDAKMCQDAITKLQQQYGFIDTLIHNAGIIRDNFMHKSTYEQWDEVINTNLNSCYYVTRPLIEKMRENQFGRIVVLSSINALKGQVGQTNYCASKAGIIGFAKSLALENAKKGITVNIVAPGYIDTDMTKVIPEKVKQSIIEQIPVGRFGKTEEIAKAVSFLCHESSAFITGETLNINGGQYLS
ncbi:MAG TPA: beta-ketoacyl-ACP reductase [Holosporales bacterium]|nr:beta-ketoacyl-ACP reductase [Holosporales bacterium]